MSFGSLLLGSFRREGLGALTDSEKCGSAPNVELGLAVAPG